MAIVKDPVDVVIVGMGWTGAIMAKELTDEGLNVVALERGADRDTQPDFAYPRVNDELEGSVHRRYLQSLSKETVTIRHGLSDTAAPYRQIGSFKPGTGVGGLFRLRLSAPSRRVSIVACRRAAADSECRPHARQPSAPHCQGGQH